MRARLRRLPGKALPVTADTETIREALDMLDVLAEYAGISLKQPPDEVFRHLQRLHGLPEVGGPPERDPRAALGRVEEREAEAAKMLQDAQEMIEEHNWAPSSVHRAASVLTAVRRARAAAEGRAEE